MKNYKTVFVVTCVNCGTTGVGKTSEKSLDRRGGSAPAPILKRQLLEVLEDLLVASVLT